MNGRHALEVPRGHSFLPRVDKTREALPNPARGAVSRKSRDPAQFAHFLPWVEGSLVGDWPTIQEIECGRELSRGFGPCYSVVARCLAGEVTWNQPPHGAFPQKRPWSSRRGTNLPQLVVPSPILSKKFVLPL